VISRIIESEVGRGRGYQLKPKAEADNPYRYTETLITLDITKTESNNCFIIH